MTAPHYQQLTTRRRRRLLARSLLRSSLSAALLVAVYFVAPLDRPGSLGAFLALTLGLLLFAGLVTRQVREVLAADYPMLRAVEGLGIALPLLLVLFAGAYLLIEQGRPGSFSEPLNHTDALYFTVTVFATVGFGDIVPVTGTARVVTTAQMLFDVLAVGVIAKVLFGAVQAGMRRGSGRHD